MLWWYRFMTMDIIRLHNDTRQQGGLCFTAELFLATRTLISQTADRHPVKNISVIESCSTFDSDISPTTLLISNWYRVVYDVVEGTSTRRRSRIPCVVVEKQIKSRRTLNKNFCDLFTAITYIKIPASYLIISYKNWCVSSALRHQGLLIISSESYFYVFR